MLVSHWLSLIHGLEDLPCGYDFILSAVRVSVHGGADIRMPCDALKGLDIHMCRRHRDIGVPEDMSRCTVHINLLADSFPCALVRRFRDGIILPYHISAQLPHGG